jgi:hypothetical protein
VPSKHARAETKRLQDQAEKQRAEHRAFIDSLPAPDSFGHVIPLVHQLVNEINDEAGLRFQANTRHVRAIIGVEAFIRLYTSQDA